jgi:hypothetical protein
MPGPVKEWNTTIELEPIEGTSEKGEQLNKSEKKNLKDPVIFL